MITKQTMKQPNSEEGIRPGFIAVLACVVLAVSVLVWFGTRPKLPSPPKVEEPPPVVALTEGSAPPDNAARAKPRSFLKRRGAPRRSQSPPAPATPPLPSLEAQWGIQVCAMRLSMANSFVDLRYKVLDPTKAARLADGKTASYLLDSNTGTRLLMPTPPKEGAFPATANKLFAGKTYFAVVANRGGAIRSGSKVAVQVGGVQSTNLIIE